MNEIKLSIDGKEYNFSLGLGFFGEVAELTGVEIEEIYGKLDENPLKWMPTIMYCSAKYECFLNGEDPNFTLKSMSNKILSEDGGINSDVVLSFYSALNKSMTKDVPVEKDDGQGSKKK